jgi:hypothetical protein
MGRIRNLLPNERQARIEQMPKGALFELIDSSSSSIAIKVIRDFPK